MFAQAHTPDRLTASQLDAYLEKGWFRMMQTIFTTNFIRNENEIRSTIWLRIDLDEYIPDNQHKALSRRNAAFRTAVQLAVLTPEKEALYARYKQSLSFQGSESLQQMLFGKEERTVYTTCEVTVHVGDRLIACGFFDLGAMSAEGISSFYDPDFKKHSLGKYLIYLKIQYCKELGLRYFYPGYFVPGNPHFDYKLTIGRAVLQFFQLSSQSWKDINSFSDQCNPLEVMRQKLMTVQSILTHAGKKILLMKYYFFDANLIPGLGDTGLFDFPLFLSCGPDEESANPILIFDVRDGNYHLLVCTPVWKPGDLTLPDDFYGAFFLTPTSEIHVGENGEEMANVILKSLE